MDNFKSLYKHPYMILIVLYCKLKVKQALYKLKCDKVPLIVIICIESLAARLVHSMFINTVVYRK